MTVAEIITTAQNLSEEVYDNSAWIRFINMALDDLSVAAKVLQRVTIANLPVTNNALTLPLSHTELVGMQELLNVYITPITPLGTLGQLRRLPISDNMSTGWKLTNNAILIQLITTINNVPVTLATITLDTYTRLPHVVSLTDIPPLPTQYLPLIVLFICAKSQQREEEYDGKNDFYNEYLTAKHDFATERMWAAEPHNRKQIRDLRTFGQLGIRQQGRR